MEHEYYHVFFTRLAVDLAVMSHGNVAGKPRWHINRIIQFWFKFGSKFLYDQTINRGFEVRMLYSPRYEDLVFSYNYPDFVKFYEYTTVPAEQQWRILDDVPHPCLVHRLDADDQYSRDFFMYSELRANTIYESQHEAMLHKQFIQFDTRTLLTSPVITITTPHFITVRLLEGEVLAADGKDPLHCKQHGILRRFNVVGSGRQALALECLHGCNLVNRWFGGKKGVLMRNKRFTYGGNELVDPTAIGSKRRKSSNK